MYSDTDKEPTESEWLTYVEASIKEKGIKHKPNVSRERQAWIEYNRRLEREHAAHYEHELAVKETALAYSAWLKAQMGL